LQMNQNNLYVVLNYNVVLLLMNIFLCLSAPSMVTS
jgi:hypothetical protein